MSQQWEGLVLETIKRVERNENDILQEAFVELAEAEGARASFWVSFRDKIDEESTEGYNGLSALYQPETWSSSTEIRYREI